MTDQRVELDGERIELLDARLQLLKARLVDTPTVSITYFQPDARKHGGSYETATGVVKRIDTIKRVLVLRDGRQIAIGDIYNVDGELFSIRNEITSK